MSAPVREAVRAFLRDTFMYRGSIDAIADDGSLIDAGILDSVGVLALISFLEERYEMTIADDEVEPENLGSVDAIAELVARKTGAR